MAKKKMNKQSPSYRKLPRHNTVYVRGTSPQSITRSTHSTANMVSPGATSARLITSNVQDDIWIQRMNGLKQAITALRDTIGKIGNPTTQQAHITMFNQVVDSLEKFAEGQFNYFHQLLIQSPVQAPKGFTHDFALATTLQQIGRDIEVIQRAVTQRLGYSSVPLSAGVNKNSVNDVFQIADHLASEALQTAVDAGLLSTKPAVITYLQKASSIRVIPYVDAAIIGIPYTCLECTRDLLAIPHEVGHYVYWHGKINTGDFAGLKIASLKHKLHLPSSGIPTYIWAWVEEIFADTYGCKLAGTLIVKDFQDLLRETFFDADAEVSFVDSPYEGINHNDGHHPVPAIRPQIYAETLRLSDENARANELNNEWETRLGLTKLNQMSIKPKPDDPSIAPDQPGYVLAALPSAKAIVQEFDNLFDRTKIGKANGFWQNVKAQLGLRVPLLNLTDAYEIFDEVINNLSPSTLGASSGTITNPLTDWRALYDDLQQKDQQLQAVLARFSTSTPSLSQDDRKWFVALNAGGWIDGPGDGNPSTGN